MMALSGQTIITSGPRTACFSVLIETSCAWIAAAVLMMPVDVTAQQPDVPKIDKARILTCIAGAEKLPSDDARRLDAARVCVSSQIDDCSGDGRSTDRTPREMRAACIGARSWIWGELLQESYVAVADALAEFDRKQPTSDAALPLFTGAHDAWHAWAMLECEYERALARGGSDVPLVAGMCMVGQMSQRTLEYRLRQKILAYRTSR